VHLPAELWEQTILPARLPGYQPRWLDDALSSGQWTWVCRGESERGPSLAFLQRDTLDRLPPPPVESAIVDRDAEAVVECLRSRGALFVTDLARDTGRDPATARRALWELLHLGLVTNDHFNVIRTGQPSEAHSRERRARNAASMLRPTRSGLRAPRSTLLEGRWSLVPWARPDMETQAVFLASVLLQRYGIVARELALMDQAMLPWRVLYEVLSRMELSGDVRRGYFVEGLSGAQFALPEAAGMLRDLTLPSAVAAPAVLVHSLDPANLYGSGAAFDILVQEEPYPFLRRAGNWLVFRAGRPILLIEQQARRLMTLPSANRDDLTSAVACLPQVLMQHHGRELRRKMTVEEWNGQPITGTEGRELLEGVGFVRDYQAMTLYPTWR
jgi:ATP-dependent Lhr-like helicase